MAETVDRHRKGDGPERDQLAEATVAEVLSAYRAEAARRDALYQAFLTLCLYKPAPPYCGSDWHLELISDQVMPWALVSQ